VVSFDPEHKLYAVKYDDGDSEELTEKDCPRRPGAVKRH
jgi:hypothetical protein